MMFSQIADSIEMERAQEEMKRLCDDLEPATRKWTNHLRQPKYFKKMYNKQRHGQHNRIKNTGMSTDVSIDTVDSMTDISNYQADSMNSIIGEYTMIQALGWRQRMLTHNRGKNEHWQILASKPPPLGRRTSKRKRSDVPKQVTPMRCDLRYAAFTRGTSLATLKNLKTNDQLTQYLQKNIK